MIQNHWFINTALLSIAFIWGITFVVVQEAISTIDPFSFNFLRFGLAAVLIFLFLFFTQKEKFSFKTLFTQLKIGSFLGLLLFLGYALQTFSLLHTTPGKSGFLTGLAVALVPIISYFILRQKPTFQGMVGVVLAVLGLYLLAFSGMTGVNIGDLLALLCSFAFGLQIVYTGKFASKTSVLYLVLSQLITVAVLSGIFALIFEPTLSLNILLHPSVIGALLVTSIFATVIAYIAQTFFQKSTSPSKVALIFSMEPVFAALADYLWNATTLGTRSIFGCLLILFGMLLAEIPLLRYFSFLKIKNQKANM
ncbi:DMT family transporter [Neobacillus niacini]|uniref:DMT family transporter n=1 Tax=Neobacillus niacini TaxID=86668 RepID=UPI0028545AF4|nr:DMT family transporter [Neobacillus niacini]MDR7000149.1 drug/metabolite transporter (DMT)-like permease [Neobacillus niacini]